MFGWLRRKSKAELEAKRPVRARYDAAQTTDDNFKHWLMADNLGPVAENSQAVRRTLRSRGRYEYSTNCWCRGIVDTKALYVIGSGPRLQVLTEDPGVNRQIEVAWARWAKTVGLASTLRMMRVARGHTGESFLVLGTNPESAARVKLWPQLIEADRVSNPYLMQDDSSNVDGIRFDDFGNPVEYQVLDQHPGETSWTLPSTSFTTLPAELMIHYFHATRAGQRRGVPDVTPALPLFAYGRRFGLAVVSAAETAAYHTGVIESELPADDEDPSDASPEAMDQIELARNMHTFLPSGSRLAQLKAEQPTTGHADFVRCILNEIARCMNMPLNVAMGNSAGYNYASGRLDHQTFFRDVTIEQDDIESVVLDRLFDAWLESAVLTSGVLPQGLRMVGADLELPYQWFWDGYEHVDPAKEANAQKIKLANLVTNRAIECAKSKLDWREVARQAAVEEAYYREVGLTAAPVEDESVAVDDDDDRSQDANPE